jgi:hypothetical protein
MMDELVRKQDVIDAIHKEWDEVLVFDESGSTIANCCEEVISNLPSIKLKKKIEREAKVIIERYKNKSLVDLGVIISDEKFFCGNCKYELEIKYDYCPKCGSKLIWI